MGRALGSMQVPGHHGTGSLGLPLGLTLLRNPRRRKHFGLGLHWFLTRSRR